MEMNAARLVAYLNALNVGEMDALRAKLLEARRACEALDLAELSEKIGEAIEALDKADLKTYRKRVATVVARLGHVK